jgi:hypothetical protein
MFCGRQGLLWRERSRGGSPRSRRSGRTGHLPRSALCRARGGLRAQVRVSIRDRPDHPLVSLLMTREPVHAARNESAPTQTVHRPLHRCSITKGVFTLRAFRYASHARNRSMRAEGSGSSIRITDDGSRRLKAAVTSSHFSIVCRQRKTKGLARQDHTIISTARIQLVQSALLPTD